MRFPGRQLFDHASIHIKLLVTPAVAMVALALICLSAWQSFQAHAKSDAVISFLTWTRLQQASSAKLQAAELQATMFRFTTMALMGLQRSSLERMGDDINQRNAALESAIRGISSAAGDDRVRGRLAAAAASYRAESSHVVAELLGNVGWGAVTARSAAVALDGVIDAVGAEERAALDTVHAAQAADSRVNAYEEVRMLLIVNIAGMVMILTSLMMARRIAEPIRRLTATMVRLAERQYDDAIPESSRRDEIGSMARAVQVFKEGLQHADALAKQQEATQFFLDTVLEHVPAPILVKRAADLSYAFVNRAARRFFGTPLIDVVGLTARHLVSEESAASITIFDKEALDAGHETIHEAVVLETLNNGHRLATYNRLAISGVDGKPQYLLTMIEDTTERRQAERRIAFMAHYDALTSLPNRVLFAERLAQALNEARANRSLIAVLGLDLDRFKEVNDTFGHAGGDALLRSMAARLSACMRQGDTLARLGGDEFAIIQRNLRQPDDAEALAQRLIDAAHEPTDLDGRKAFIGISIGIAFNTPDVEASDLVKQADLSLYEAKRTGRGCYKCFAPEMTARLQQRRTLESDLHAAMEAGELELHYQPQVNLQTNEILGAEALLRWTCRAQGAIPPSVFIPLAEETGMIVPLGAWLLRTACEEAVRWPGDLLIAVNVSPVQLRDPSFLDSVRAALDASGLDPARLELEVTEGVLLQEGEQTSIVLAALRALGIKLALDDFGTGYASLGYLQQFRFDTIKIDRSFVRNLGSNKSAAAIVRAITGLGQALGTRTIAEGVESLEEVAVLRAYGCVEGQGFLFWRPMAAGAMRALVEVKEAVLF